MIHVNDDLAGDTRRYAVMLHGFNLVLLDERGNARVGGLHTWCYVTAKDEADAIAVAVQSVRQNEVFLQEVQNASAFPPAFEAEEVVPLHRDELAVSEGTALVFYIDTENETSN